MAQRLRALRLVLGDLATRKAAIARDLEKKKQGKGLGEERKRTATRTLLQKGCGRFRPGMAWQSALDAL